MKAFFIIGLAVFWLVLSVPGEGRAVGEAPVTRDLSTTRGKVIFPHERHQQLAKSCEICHHMGVDAGPCRPCHESDASAPNARDAFHKLCMGCHKHKEGPLGCYDCHHR